MVRPRLHLVGLPHSCTDHSTTVCAFTTKAEKFTKMMRGWEIVLYWGDRNDCPVSEHVVLHTEQDRKQWYGEGNLDPNTLPAVAGVWDWESAEWREFNARAISELSSRVEPHDLILLTGGWAAHPVAHAFPGVLSCEWAAGYSGWFSPYVCFESSTWRSHCYGSKGITDGRFYDTVIPNFFDPAEWPSKLPAKEDYLVYLGRLIYQKGITVAAEVAQRSGLPLYVAGSGAAEVSEGLIVTHDGCRLEGDVHYVGTVGAQERAKLLGGARALLCPTLYIEPFGAVAVEAQLSGTQPIATDFGAFTETVAPEFRFATISEAVSAVERAGDVKPAKLRKRALERWSLEAIEPLYNRWFERLHGLHDGGFYS